MLRIIEITAKFGRLGGYFFLLLKTMYRNDAPDISISINWIKSDHVM